MIASEVGLRKAAFRDGMVDLCCCPGGKGVLACPAPCWGRRGWQDMTYPAFALFLAVPELDRERLQ